MNAPNWLTGMAPRNAGCFTSETARAAGRKGGKTGGKNRMAMISPEQRTELARKGAVAANVARTPEQRKEIGRRAGLASAAKKTPEQRSELSRRGAAAANKKRWRDHAERTD